ncbi:SipW-dependent-type signal peptide-containing protein [Halorubrum sp. CBA1125]|uniref:SipW-dependent-type signal peptide-containing protein n=1 Tax=Halorubrum sp. CBA1125 TaxID=2668072 RepID=UPI0018D244DC|nr:SipW-dependent-type signal peptide-containing protein [Halorubrum sp. CBA1125]
MSDDNSDRFSLSRRKALASLGGIGAATALGGIGTYAQFTDTEAVQASFGAGELNGVIDYAASYNGEEVASGENSDAGFDAETEITGDNAAGVAFSYSLTDIKPGDYGSVVFGVNVQTNPAWPILCLGVDNSQENGIVESEAVAEQDANPFLGFQDLNSEGELEENILMVPFYDTNVESSFFDSDGPSQQALDNYGSGTALAFWDNADDGSGKLFPRSLSNIVTEDPDNQLRQGTVQFNEESDNGAEVFVASGLGDLDGDADDTACFALNGGQTDDSNVQGVSPLAPGSQMNFGFDWHVPYSVGNEIQTDSVDVYFTWIFQQVRHSEGPDGPFSYAPGNFAASESGEGDDPENSS